MELIKFYTNASPIEVHITQDEASNGDGWTCIGGSNFSNQTLDLDNHYKQSSNKFSVNSNDEGIKLQNNLVDLSILSNMETSMFDEDILKQRFSDYEIENLKNSARNEAHAEFKQLKVENQREWEMERKQLEEFYENKIVDSERQVEELLAEKMNFEKVLQETR